MEQEINRDSRNGIRYREEKMNSGNEQEASVSQTETEKITNE